MRVLLSILLVSLAPYVSADLRSLGHDYRTMLSNYHMLELISAQCPDVELPEVAPRAQVEKNMQDKIGIDNYVPIMIQIQRSDLRKNAQETVNKLLERLDGCEDPRLVGALERISQVHGETYARFIAEPSIVQPKEVPVPLRRQ